ncbi:enoyl-CoA hydratase/carnithine racemase [Paucimonas lemoignei]|uniref:Enoyl-CoA hydratase/carnithine racemase n=1 Tax=Paucimonas lemoignei TaxID=29443 RepID=A0A4V2UIS2_PAULE|nr:enoyl-CoA hydratase/isomerase family protein [Paucimonas lemoignei]TCS37280.1 enoyl-CoA hydratase/carnithine racemase [Paucimonas lemoignei]
MTDLILLEIRNRLGVITLNRPQALNSLSLEMIRSITQALLAWRDDDAIDGVLIESNSSKAFCAGGDIRFFYELGKSTPQQGSALIEDFFTEEYLLNQLIHHYPKPYIAVMDGIVMGGGMGIAQCHAAGRLRIATERTKMAMPEVNIGLFPDIGGSYFLSHCPGQLGTWLALTANAIGAADALHLGLADMYIPSAELPTLKSMLQSSGGGDLPARAREFAASFECDPSQLALQREVIDRHFAFDDVASIMASLESDPSPFTQDTLSVMKKRSPLMLVVTLQELRRGAHMSIEECLRMERSMMRHCFMGGEALEGIRATVIDKDMRPTWSPAALDDVAPEMVEEFFQPVWPDHAHPLRNWL